MNADEYAVLRDLVELLQIRCKFGTTLAREQKALAAAELLLAAREPVLPSYIYARSQIIDGTGFSKGARFIQVEETDSEIDNRD